MLILYYEFDSGNLDDARTQNCNASQHRHDAPLNGATPCWAAHVLIAAMQRTVTYLAMPWLSPPLSFPCSLSACATRHALVLSSNKPFCAKQTPSRVAPFFWVKVCNTMGAHAPHPHYTLPGDGQKHCISWAVNSSVCSHIPQLRLWASPWCSLVFLFLVLFGIFFSPFMHLGALFCFVWHPFCTMLHICAEQ